jgi:SM-20-related protein
MMRAEALRRFGLFVQPNFITRTDCAALRAAARAASLAPATVYDGDNATRLQVGVRRTTRATVSPDIARPVTARVMAVMDAIEHHFQVPLTACQEPQFLIYQPGDFFSRHSDGGDEPDEPPHIRSRRISVVIFLGDEGDDVGEGSYSGGSLLFYGLVADERLKNRGFRVVGESGLLVAFRSTSSHAVTPVVSGERYSIVTWFV